MTWTGNAERMFGWSASEVVGKRVDEWRFVYEEDWDRVRKTMDAMQRGQNFVGHNRNYRKDGRIIYCEWHNSALLDSTGAYSGGLSYTAKQDEELGLSLGRRCDPRGSSRHHLGSGSET